jgi:hypothetical protein
MSYVREGIMINSKILIMIICKARFISFSEFICFMFHFFILMFCINGFLIFAIHIILSQELHNLFVTCIYELVNDKASCSGISKILMIFTFLLNRNSLSLFINALYFLVLAYHVLIFIVYFSTPIFILFLHFIFVILCLIPVFAMFSSFFVCLSYSLH